MVVIVPGLTKTFGVNLTPEGNPIVVDSYKISKRSYKEGSIITFFPNYTLLPHCCRVCIIIIVLSVDYFTRPNDIRRRSFLVPK